MLMFSVGPRCPRTNVACGDDSFFVSGNRTSNLFPDGGSKQNFGRKENPRHDDTFWVITLVCQMDLAEVLSVSSFNIKECFRASDGPRKIF